MASSTSSKNSTTNKTGTTSKVDPSDQITQIDDTPKPTGGKIYFEVDKPSDKLFSSVLKPLDSVSDGSYAIAYISQGYSSDGLTDNLCDSYWLDSALPILDDSDKASAGLSDFGKWIQHAEDRGLKVHAYAPALDSLRNIWTYEQYRDNEKGKIIGCDAYTKNMIDEESNAAVHDHRSEDERYELFSFPWKRLPAGSYVFMDGANYTALINAYRVVQHYGFSLGVLIEHPNDGYLATAQSFKSKKDPSLYIMGYSKKKASATDFPKDEFDGYYWQTTSKTGDVTAFGGEDFHGLLNRYNEPIPLIPVDPIDSKPAKATKKAYVGLGYDHKLKSGQTLGYSPDGNSKHFKAAVTPWGFTFQQYDATRMWRLLKPYIIESAEAMQGRQGNPGKNGVSPTIDKATKHWLMGDIDTGVVAQGKDGQTPSIDPKSHHWMIGGKDTGQSSVGPAGPAGVPGKAGKDGKDGSTPDINEAGNWVVGGQDTGIRAEGMTGADGATPMIDPETFHWMIDGADTGVIAKGINGHDGKNGRDGVSPVIDPKTKDWTINGNDTGIKAAGVDGKNGKDGKNGARGTKVFSAVGKWSNGIHNTSTMFGGDGYATVETFKMPINKLQGSDQIEPASGDYILLSFEQPSGVVDEYILKITVVDPANNDLTAEGYQLNGNNGKDGVTPSIDANSKHWMIGTTDTGVSAQGQNGRDGKDGKDGTPGQPGKDGSSIYVVKYSGSSSSSGHTVYKCTVSTSDIENINGRTPKVGELVYVEHNSWLVKINSISGENLDCSGVSLRGDDGQNGNRIWLTKPGISYGNKSNNNLPESNLYEVNSWTHISNGDMIIDNDGNVYNVDNTYTSGGTYYFGVESTALTIKGKPGTKVWHAANKKITAPIWGSWFTDLEQVSTTNLPVVGDLVITADGKLSQITSTASTADGNILHGSFNTGDSIATISGKRGTKWWTTTETQPYNKTYNMTDGTIYAGKTSADLGITKMTSSNPPQEDDMLLCGNGDVYRIYNSSYENNTYSLYFTSTGINLKS